MSTYEQVKAERKIELGRYQDRKPDRYVRGFGGVQHAIYQPVGTPKAPEDCQPFTFTMVTMSDIPEGAKLIDPNSGRYSLPDGRYGYAQVPNVQGQEKFAKQLSTLLTKQARETARKAKAAAKVAA